MLSSKHNIIDSMKSNSVKFMIRNSFSTALACFYNSGFLTRTEYISFCSAVRFNLFSASLLHGV